MLLDSLILGTIIGKFRGGKFVHFVQIDFSSPWLIILAFFIQYFSIFFLQKFLLEAIIISYSCLFLFIFLNNQNVGFKLITLGMTLNIIVMFVNGGRIPVEMKAAIDLSLNDASRLLTGEFGKYVTMSSTTHLNFLGDIFYLHAPYPHPIIVSLGDIILSIGVFIFIQHVMLEQKSIIKGV